MRLTNRLSLPSNPRVALGLIAIVALVTTGFRAIDMRSATASAEEHRFVFLSKHSAPIMDVRNGSEMDFNSKRQPSDATTVNVRNGARKDVDTKLQPSDATTVNVRNGARKDVDTKLQPSDATTVNVRNGARNYVDTKRQPSDATTVNVRNGARKDVYTKRQPADATTVNVRKGSKKDVDAKRQPADATTVNVRKGSRKDVDAKRQPSDATTVNVRNGARKDVDAKRQPADATTVNVRNGARKDANTKPQPSDPSSINARSGSSKKEAEGKQELSDAKLRNVNNGLRKVVTSTGSKSNNKGINLRTPMSKRTSQKTITKRITTQSHAKASPMDQYRLDIPDTSSRTESNSLQEHRMSAVCADTVCGENFLFNLTISSNQPLVPAIRHILWKSENISSYFLRQLQTWQRIHPNWTFVLWRDSDLEPFVRKHFPGKIHQKFASLPTTKMESIERIDMFRYILMYKFGGVYADLDYTLVSSLDSYRRYPAVVTREPEAHAAQVFGLARWPLSILASPAFFMSAPGHPFFFFALHQLVDRSAATIMSFAGPLGLSNMLNTYFQEHKSMVHLAEFVYIPPSYSFYQYNGNRLDTAGHKFLKERIQFLNKTCNDATDSTVPQVQQFCKNLLNLDPITDKSQPVIAIHDMQKKQSVYENAHGKEFVADLQNLKLHVKNLKLGDSL